MTKSQLEGAVREIGASAEAVEAEHHLEDADWGPEEGRPALAEGTAMPITNHAEYRAAVERAAAVSDAAECSETAREFNRLNSEIREWDEAHKGENAHGPEEDQSLLRPDDLPFSGLPGNLGKLYKD